MLKWKAPKRVQIAVHTGWDRSQASAEAGSDLSSLALLTACEQLWVLTASAADIWSAA